MITKERLEELKKEGATIYWLIGKMVLNIHLDSSYYVSDANILCNKRSEDEKTCVDYIENLYETKEQAKWALKYYATRTEELTLPMWEDYTSADSSIIRFYAKERKYTMYIYVKNKKTNNCRILIRADDGEQDWLVFEEPATKENYIKACNLCLKLFKGE